MIVVTNNGHIYVAYEIQPANDYNQAYIKVVRSIDGGATFSDINFPAAYPTGADNYEIGTDGTNVYLYYCGKYSADSWRVMLYKYDGISWSGYYSTTVIDSGWYIGNTCLACNSGKEYMVHTEQNAASTPSINRLYLNIFTDTTSNGTYLIKQYSESISVLNIEIGDNIAYISIFNDNGNGKRTLIIYDLNTHSIINEIDLLTDSFYGSLLYNCGSLYYAHDNVISVLRNNQWVTYATFSTYGNIVLITDGTNNLICIIVNGGGKYYLKYNGNYWNTIRSDLDISEYPEQNTFSRVTNNTIYSVARYSNTDGTYCLYFFSHDSKLGAPYVTLNNRAPFDSTQNADLTWNYSDIDNDSQNAYEVLITDVSNGSIALDTGKIVSTNSTYTIPANSLQTGKQYQWKVKVWDATDSPSQFSSTGIFTTGMTPVVTIINPIAGIIAVSNVTTKWTFSSGSGSAQASYRLYLTSADDNILWDTGKISSTAKNKSIDYILQNNISYKIKLTAWDNNNLQSAEVVVKIDISYTPPAIPTILINYYDKRGSIELKIVNPDPQGTQPKVSYCDIYREDTRIATNIQNSFTEYTLQSEKNYSYKIVAIGSNGTSSSTEISGINLKLFSSQLALVSDYTKFVNLIYEPNREHSKKYDMALMHFAGREKPVSEFSENEDTGIKLSFSIFDEDTLNELENLISSKQTLLYRDNRKRRIFCTCDELDIEDDLSGMWKVSLNLNEVDYQEAI